MSSADETKLSDWLSIQSKKTFLQFVVCGSVDDGKSTLIGRLLYDSGCVPNDQLELIREDSRKWGTQDGAIDFSLLVDGLSAEREQKITIDVAYRYFSTEQRNYIIADAPGHEQYTRNMVTAASTAELALILVDASKGIGRQTLRHAYAVSFLGIKKVILVVNKLDLIGYSKSEFQRITDEFKNFGKTIELSDISCVPVCATTGENVVFKSDRTPWYDGPSLLSLLDAVDIENFAIESPFRLPVQLVIRPTDKFRGYAGKIASGAVAVGDQVSIQPSGVVGKVRQILSGDGEVKEARCGQSVTIVFDDELDVSRGDLISSTDISPHVADQFEVSIVCLGDQPLLPGRVYFFKSATKVTNVSITKIKYKIDISKLNRLAAESLLVNDIGVCNIQLDSVVAVDSYLKNRSTGSFIIIDKVSFQTVAAGVINFPLFRAGSVSSWATSVNKERRSELKQHKPVVVWFTGISGAGKSTIANLLEVRLSKSGCHTYLLDGDNVRRGLNRDLGFSVANRIENIRRVGEVAKLMVDAGLIVLASFITPYRTERQMLRELFYDGEFVEVFVDTTLEVAEARDVKGLYRKVRSGRIKNFTGVDSLYESPDRPDIHIRTSQLSAEVAADVIFNYLKALGVFAESSTVIPPAGVED